MSCTKGFSLIELSVVLIIIALIIGGILAGKSIKSTAQVQATISDLGKYKQAAISYKEKYYYWPGDDPEAGSVWQNLGGNHGNGDGVISGCGSFSCPSAAGQIALPGEALLAFQELALGGFITGTYNNTSTKVVINGNLPEAPIDIVSNGYLSKPVYIYYYVTTLVGGAQSNSNVIALSDFNGLIPRGGITPSQALAIDIKIDDGLPYSGLVEGSNHFLTGDGTISKGSVTCAYAGTYDINGNTLNKCEIWLNIE